MPQERRKRDASCCWVFSFSDRSREVFSPLALPKEVTSDAVIEFMISTIILFICKEAKAFCSWMRVGGERMIPEREDCIFVLLSSRMKARNPPFSPSFLCHLAIYRPKRRKRKRTPLSLSWRKTHSCARCVGIDQSYCMYVFCM